VYASSLSSPIELRNSSFQSLFFGHNYGEFGEKKEFLGLLILRMSKAVEVCRYIAHQKGIQRSQIARKSKVIQLFDCLYSWEATESSRSSVD
jgi:hypothetical protein